MTLENAKTEAATTLWTPPAEATATPGSFDGSCLAGLDEQYGSAEDYLIECGVSQAQIDAVREHLLV